MIPTGRKAHCHWTPYPSEDMNLKIWMHFLTEIEFKRETPKETTIINSLWLFIIETHPRRSLISLRMADDSEKRWEQCRRIHIKLRTKTWRANSLIITIDAACWHKYNRMGVKGYDLLFEKKLPKFLLTRSQWGNVIVITCPSGVIQKNVLKNVATEEAGFVFFWDLSKNSERESLYEIHNSHDFCWMIFPGE